jgi:hypothetical protein
MAIYFFFDRALGKRLNTIYSILASADYIPSILYYVCNIYYTVETHARRIY